MKNNRTSRELKTVVKGRPATDGAGVKLSRVIGTAELDMLDPFLLLDHFESDSADDYIAGFPAHPHRGFETVTYLLNGRMRHRDNAGHEGVIESGGVQWMTAGRGIVHSEMPEQEEGLMQGFQLWVNLPAAFKMQAPAYQEFPVDQITREEQDNGTTLRVIAGRSNAGSTGPVHNTHVDPLYIDVSLPAGEALQQDIAQDHNAFIYVIDGEIVIGEQAAPLGARALGVLDDGSGVSLTAKSDARFLLVAGRPLHEPVERAGPFVMNTRAEVMQAFDDFQNNRF